MLLIMRAAGKSSCVATSRFGGGLGPEAIVADHIGHVYCTY